MLEMVLLFLAIATVLGHVVILTVFFRRR